MGRLLAEELLQNSHALALAYSLSWMGSRELALAEEILQNSRALTLFYSLCRAWALVKGLSSGDACESIWELAVSPQTQRSGWLELDRPSGCIGTKVRTCGKAQAICCASWLNHS